MTLRLPNAPKKLLIGQKQTRYIIGPGDQGVLGYICDRVVNKNPRYVPSSFTSGTIGGNAMLSRAQVGVIDIIFGDRKVKDRGILISIHQLIATLPDEVSYEPIESERFIERINKYKNR